MIEIFLLVIAFIWLVFASIYDLKNRIVLNWLSFSFIIFILGFRFFYSLFNQNFNFFYQGIIGLGIFFIIGNLLYYGRIFAGGDAKLMISLGVLLPFSDNFLTNIKIFVIFILIFIIVGAIYGFLLGLIIPFDHINNYKKGIKNKFNENKKIIYFSMIFGILLIIIGFLQIIFFYFGILFFIFPYFYIHAKAVDEYCLVKTINTQKLMEGDWLFDKLKIGKKEIEPNWKGLTLNEIKLIRKKYRQVRIKYGIPFVPVFLVSFIILVYFYSGNFENLWNSFWNPQIFSS